MVTKNNIINDKGYKRMDRRYSINDYRSAQFFQLPKWLFKGKYEKMLTNNERILYAILKERFSISIANQWTDEAGNIFFFYKQQELAECSCLCLRTVQRSIKNLKEAGLLEEERSGANIPNRLYLLKPESEEFTDKEECTQDNIPSDKQPETENGTPFKSCTENNNSAEMSESVQTGEKERTCQIVVSVENASENGYDKMSYPSADAENCENGHDKLSPRTCQTVIPDTTNCHPNNTELINKKELINNQYQYHNHTAEHDSECDNDFSGINTQTEKFNQILSEFRERVEYNRFCNCDDMVIFKEIADDILSIIVSELYFSLSERNYNVGSKNNPVMINSDTIKCIFFKHLNYSVFFSYIRQFLSSAKPVRNNPATYHIVGLYRQCIYRNTKMFSSLREEC